MGEGVVTRCCAVGRDALPRVLIEDDPAFRPRRSAALPNPAEVCAKALPPQLCLEMATVAA